MRAMKSNRMVRAALNNISVTVYFYCGLIVLEELCGI